jgi:hypothetical protein
VAVQVLRRDRFLEPTDFVVFDAAAQADGFHGVIGVVGVDHQADLRADCLAHRLHRADVVVDAEADLQLHGLVAQAAGFEGFLAKVGRVVGAVTAVEAGGVGLDLVADGAAHEAVDGLAEVFSFEVP